MYFETIYPELQGLSGEQQVCCPFPHTKANGTTYYDHTPSMCINLDKRVYHCCSCGAQGNEAKMITEMQMVPASKAKNLLSMLEYGVDRGTYYNEVNSSRDKLTQKDNDYYDKVCAHFGLDKSMLAEELVLIKDNEWITPVIWHDHVVDIRTYRPGQKNKVMSQPGAPSGLMIPRDSWDPKRLTLICAGEKDMWVARSRGFNAITFTGGEMNSTFFDMREFKDVEVAICYDNDQAGRSGAIKLANILASNGAIVRNVTKFHDDFPELDTKEDLTDWFVDYHHTPEELKEYIKSTPIFETDVVEVKDELPTLSLIESIEPKYEGRKFRARVQVLMVTDEAYQIAAEAKCTKVDDERGAMSKGQEYIWTDEGNAEFVFSYVGYGDQRQMEQIKKKAVGPEKGVVTKITKSYTAHIATVADVKTEYGKRKELPVVCLNWVPSQGKVYDMVLIRVHSTLEGTLGAVCVSYEEVNDTLSSVLSTQDVTNLLTIRNTQGSVEDRVLSRARKVQGLVGYEAPLQMILLQDLTMNSVKSFNLLNGKDVRGYMDTLVVGESRVGKSDVAQHLQNAYGLGEFVSLAGTAATLPGIVGGSCKDSMGKMSTKAGVLPRNDGGLVIFEELSKAPEDVVRSLTDVRSSGKARITRVSGSYEMPASLRMLALSNAKPSEDGTTVPLDNYAHGIDVMQELIGTAEDIARYDLICMVGNPEHIDPSFNADEPYSNEILRSAIRWTWTRGSEQIEFVDGADELIAQLCSKFNEENPINVKLFGPEGWKKLGRVSCAVAAYIMSAPDDFSKLIVTPEIVQFAYDFMVGCYVNDLFRLQYYTELFTLKHVCTVGDLKVLQATYVQCPQAIDMMHKLRKLSSPQMNTLLTVPDDAVKRQIITNLMSHFLIEQVGRDYRATSKWNAAYIRLKKVKVDEVDAPLN